MPNRQLALASRVARVRHSFFAVRNSAQLLWEFRTGPCFELPGTHQAASEIVVGWSCADILGGEGQGEGVEKRQGMCEEDRRR